MDLIRTVDAARHRGQRARSAAPATRRRPPRSGVLWAMKAVAERLWGDAVARGPPRVHQRRRQGGSAPRRPPARRRGAGSRWPTSAPRGRRAVAERTGATVGAARAWPTPSSATSTRRARSGGALSAATIPELRGGRGGRIGQQPARHAAGCPADRTTSGVLYAPDFVVNAGGVINIAEEKGGYDRARADERIRGIHDTVLRVLDLADAEGITTAAAADLLAERRIDAARMTEQRAELTAAGSHDDRHGRAGDDAIWTNLGP